jgi:hypothetical protein
VKNFGKSTALLRAHGYKVTVFPGTTPFIVVRRPYDVFDIVNASDIRREVRFVQDHPEMVAVLESVRRLAGAGAAAKLRREIDLGNREVSHAGQ